MTQNQYNTLKSLQAGSDHHSLSPKTLDELVKLGYLTEILPEEQVEPEFYILTDEGSRAILRYERSI